MAAGAPDDWVLLDASLSMTAEGGGSTAWSEALERAPALERGGWRVVPFGADEPPLFESDPEPIAPRTLLAPILHRAAEAGVRRVRVLSDFRLEDAVAVRSALDALPLEIELEPTGSPDLANAGISAPIASIWRRCCSETLLTPSNRVRPASRSRTIASHASTSSSLQL